MPTPEINGLIEEAKTLALKIENALARRNADKLSGDIEVGSKHDTESDFDDEEDPTEPNHLIGDGDGLNWTTEFCERNPSASFDYMAPWFMNAIYTGRMVERESIIAAAQKIAAKIAADDEKKHCQELREKEKLMPKEKVERAHAMAKEALSVMRVNSVLKTADEAGEKVADKTEKKFEEQDALHAKKIFDVKEEHALFPESLARFFGNSNILR